MRRLQTRPQFDAVMAGGTVARTAHFALHRASFEATPAAPGPGSSRPQALFAVQATWMGAVVPKRWAKRAVTRNGIRRQIFAVSEEAHATLPQAAHVVRLRAGFDRQLYPSAWSEPLRAAVRGELQQLFARAAQAGAGRPPARAKVPAADASPEAAA